MTAAAMTTPEPEIAVGDNALSTKGATTSDVASAHTFAATTARMPSLMHRSVPCCVSNAAIARGEDDDDDASNDAVDVRDRERETPELPAREDIVRGETHRVVKGE